MQKTRLEAFSDAVIAIILTIMVLELKVPHGEHLASLKPLVPVFLAYVLSFLYLGIYWNNHHHMLHATSHVDGRILWANMHLLFWLSLIPFGTAWLAENHFATVPAAMYGFILLMSGVAYWLLGFSIVSHHDSNQDLREAIGRDFKGKISLVGYLLALPLAFLNQWIAIAIYVLIAGLWLIPDRRIERRLVHRHS